MRWCCEKQCPLLPTTFTWVISLGDPPSIIDNTFSIIQSLCSYGLPPHSSDEIYRASTSWLFPQEGFHEPTNRLLTFRVTLLVRD
eukprot:Gb_33694 [translate_table: standard]